MLLFTVALVLLLFTGGGLTIKLLPLRRQVSALEFVSLSILFGSGAISVASFIGGFFVNGWWLRALVTGIALILAMAMWISARRTSIVWRIKLGWGEGIAGAILGLQFIIMIWASARLALGYDGLFIWEFKAQLIHRYGGVLPIEYFRGDPLQYSHPNYPLLVPLTDSWFYGWIGTANQGFVKLISPLFYFAIVGLLVCGGTRLSGNRWRGLTIAAMFGFIPWVVLRTVAGEADLPLGAFYLGAVIYLLEYLETEDPSLLIVVGALAAFLPWVKRDGVILWGCLLGVAMIKTMFDGRWRSWAMMVFPGAIWLCFWRIFLWGVGATLQPEYLPMTFKTFFHNIDRVPWIAAWIWDELRSWRTWSLTWLLPAAGLMNLYQAKVRRMIAAWLLLVLGPLALYGSIYIFSAWNPFLSHMETSFARLLIHLLPTVLLGGVLMFNDNLYRCVEALLQKPGDSCG